MFTRVTPLFLSSSYVSSYQGDVESQVKRDDGDDASSFLKRSELLRKDLKNCSAPPSKSTVCTQEASTQSGNNGQKRNASWTLELRMDEICSSLSSCCHVMLCYAKLG